MNECTACGEDFGTVVIFDKHRVGKHAYTFLEGMRMDPPREDGRRCLDVEEMEAKGWARDKFGRWHDPVVAAKGSARARASRERRSA